MLSPQWHISRFWSTSWRLQGHLTLAAWQGHAATCRFLIACRADPDIGKQIPDIFLDDVPSGLHGSDWTPLCAATEGGHVTAVRALLESKAEPNVVVEMPPYGVRYEQNTALTLACRNGNVQIVQLLLDSRAYVDQVCFEDWSNRDLVNVQGATFQLEFREYSALLLASQMGRVEVAKALLEARAWPDLECMEICDECCKIAGPMPQQKWQTPLEVAGCGRGRGGMSELSSKQAASLAEAGERVKELLQRALDMEGSHPGCDGCGRRRRAGWHSTNEWFCEECWCAWQNSGVRKLPICNGQGGGLELLLIGGEVSLLHDFGADLQTQA
eukprot:gnl/TRDRNA2_/TRDRNA2_128184_c2_seq1.p1 gnl/TRDRNA2_/TRDRNA2_128184_c2~~gnl/TRDRNA2_/TRDRNA2_128184_c2_seq1.p1  ORF type:complete len:359 (+),score=63.55 gnl/TRDRNA2_/TRDRNA2_128184_c2_seq1:95-1078(+)